MREVTYYQCANWIQEVHGILQKRQRWYKKNKNVKKKNVLQKRQGWYKKNTRMGYQNIGWGRNLEIRISKPKP